MSDGVIRRYPVQPCMIGLVIPGRRAAANAESMHTGRSWIPAFAGMTTVERSDVG